MSESKPQPSGIRPPPPRLPASATAFGDDANDPRAIRAKALEIAKELSSMAASIQARLEAGTDEQEEYQAALRYCLRLLDEAIKVGRGH